MKETEYSTIPFSTKSEAKHRACLMKNDPLYSDIRIKKSLDNNTYTISFNLIRG